MSLVGFLSTLFIGGKLLSEKLEKPAPPGQRFDYDLYMEDVRNGVTIEETNRRRKAGYYNTCEPEEKSKKTHR